MSLSDAIGIPNKAEIKFTPNFITITEDICGKIEAKIIRVAATD